MNTKMKTQMKIELINGFWSVIGDNEIFEDWDVVLDFKGMVEVLNNFMCNHRLEPEVGVAWNALEQNERDTLLVNTIENEQQSTPPDALLRMHKLEETL